MKYNLLLLVLFCFQSSHTLKIDRVILATDANPNYIQFWPLTAYVWSELMGIRPTLALVADDDVVVDESFGDVIRFKPIPGIPTSLQAQTIRLLLPAYFENDVCIISDIDMLPINKNYLFDPIKNLSEDVFVVYHDKAYNSNGSRYPMCYNVAKGKVFKEIFGIQNPDVDLRKIIQQWYEEEQGKWETDERMLTKYVKKWKKFNNKCIRLGRGNLGKTGQRIDRISNLHYDDNRLRRGYYVDMHCCRPWTDCKDQILNILSILGLDITDFV